MVEVLRIIKIYGSDSKIIICDQHLTGQKRGFKRLTGQNAGYFILPYFHLGRTKCDKSENVCYIQMLFLHGEKKTRRYSKNN